MLGKIVPRHNRGLMPGWHCLYAHSLDQLADIKVQQATFLCLCYVCSWAEGVSVTDIGPCSLCPASLVGESYYGLCDYCYQSASLVQYWCLLTGLPILVQFNCEMIYCRPKYM